MLVLEAIAVREIVVDCANSNTILVTFFNYKNLA